MVPHLRQNDYTAAAEAGVRRVIDIVDGEYERTLTLRDKIKAFAIPTRARLSLALAFSFPSVSLFPFPSDSIKKRAVSAAFTLPFA